MLHSVVIVIFIHAIFVLVTSDSISSVDISAVSYGSLLQDWNFTNRLNTSLAAKWALTHCLQCCTACKIQNGQRGLPPGFWTFPSTCNFFHPSIPSMIKVDAGEKRKLKKKKRKESMSFIVATNFIASRLPKR